MDIKPIETKYKGYRFRSRLEARWAVFFDTLGVEWEYEKECYQLSDGKQYLPDFWMPTGISDHGYFVEIKPIEPTEEERKKIQLLAKGTGHTSYCFWGTPDNDGNWHVCIYHKGYTSTKNGYFSSRRIGECQFLGFVDDTSEKAIGLFCFPFDYSWQISPDFFKKGRLEDGFNAFKSARFEFGEEG